MNRNAQRGAASVEYVVVTGLVVTVLFVVPVTDDMSVFEYTLAALRSFQANSTFLLSMP